MILRPPSLTRAYVQGGIMLFTADQIGALCNATLVFNAGNTDAKAQILPTLNVIEGLVRSSLTSFGLC